MGVTCLFWRHNADKYGYLALSPKLDKKERCFRWYMWYRTEFDFNVLFIHLRTRKMSFNALVYALRFKVELNWTRTRRPVIAQFVRFSKIAKKGKHRFVPIFFSSKVSTVLIQNHEIKNGGRFCGIAPKVCTICIFSDFWERTWGRVWKRYLCEREKKLSKSTFLQNLYRDITFTTHCDKESV